jgi:hypothetical protein
MAAAKKKTPAPTETETTEPAPALAPTPAPLDGFTPSEITEPAPVTDDGELKQAMLRLLKQRNLRCSVPTLVDFRMKGSQRRRYTIIDVDRDTIEAVWRLWCEAKGSYDHEAFILMLHDVMESGLPRVFRQVDPLRLED